MSKIQGNMFAFSYITFVDQVLFFYCLYFTFVKVEIYTCIFWGPIMLKKKQIELKDRIPEAIP